MIIRCIQSTGDVKMRETARCNIRIMYIVDSKEVYTIEYLRKQIIYGITNEKKFQYLMEFSTAQAMIMNRNISLYALYWNNPIRNIRFKEIKFR